MTGAYNVDAWLVSGAIAKTVEMARDVLGDQATDAFFNNLAVQLELVVPGFPWREAMSE